MAKRNTLRQEYYKTGDGHWKDLEGKPNIDYTKWLEDKVLQKQDKCALGGVIDISIADINDAPMFTHTKKFREHFSYIKSEFVRLLS